MSSTLHPSVRHLGDRQPASVRADIEAFTAWVKRFGSDYPNELRTSVQANRVVLHAVVNGSNDVNLPRAGSIQPSDLSAHPESSR